jgi:hypothetical protein
MRHFSPSDNPRFIIAKKAVSRFARDRGSCRLLHKQRDYQTPPTLACPEPFDTLRENSIEGPAPPSKLVIDFFQPGSMTSRFSSFNTALRRDIFIKLTDFIISP